MASAISETTFALTLQNGLGNKTGRGSHTPRQDTRGCHHIFRGLHRTGTCAIVSKS
jgi:ketopantoate reductase